jgi:hypothetical protein
VHIICAHQVIEDKETGLISIVQIVEKLQVMRLPEPMPGQNMVFLFQGLVIIASWLAEDGDARGDEYEVETRFLPPNAEPMPLTRAIFRIGEPDPSRSIYRFVTRFATPPQLTVPGIVLIESRVRKVGADATWISQTCPLIVELLQPPTPPPGPPPGHN